MRASSEPEGRPRLPHPLPLVGRRGDLGALRLAIDDAVDGHGRFAILSGEPGIGKSRLVEALTADADARSVRVLAGRGYALESGRPFGVWADALAPTLQALGETTVSVMARGIEWELATIVPAFASRLPGTGVGAAARDPDAKGRLFWNFVQFICRLARREPLLLVLEDAHFADASSLELAHFVGRQIAGERVLMVLSYAVDDPGAESVRRLEGSLSGVPGAFARRIEPLTTRDTIELVYRTFGVEGAPVAAFCESLHAHTGGNPFFLEEVLKSLVGSGRVRPLEGGWTGLTGTVDASLPSSVREAVTRRLEILSPASRRVAEVVALGGANATLDVVERVAGLSSDELAQALDALCARQVLVQPRQRGTAYGFVHYMVHATVAESISEARGRALHRSLASAIEALGIPSQSVDIAGHLASAGLANTPEAMPHLLRAGRDALARRADPEAARWLGEALALADRVSPPPLDASALQLLLEDLARVSQRMGDAARTRDLLGRASGIATERGDDVARARILRRLASGAVIEGRADEALAAFREAEEAARSCQRTDLVIRTRVATAMALQSLGRSAEAKPLVEEVVAVAEAQGDPGLAARVHRALLMLYGWTGPAARARDHADRALDAARASGDDGVVWSVEWALAVLEGLHGHAEGVRTHRREAERLAIALRSPLLQAATAEIAIEYASGVGDWAGALAMADEAIPLARAIAPRTLLPRILVWTGLIYLARADMDRARDLLDEAWVLSGADRDEALPPGAVHNIILAHTGRVAYHLASGEWTRALHMGERGLALADRYGYVVWAIHRLLPQVAEASLWLQDYDRAQLVAERLREGSTALGHPLGLAWAAAVEALIGRFRDGRRDAWKPMLEAARELDSIPFVFHAARLRRNAAQVLEIDGLTDEAVRVLRQAHDVFLRLGAEHELRGTRSQLRSLGVRLPPRQLLEGAGTLTGRELDIARRVTRRLSNKEIARELDISARTVSTHLSNIFQKLGVDSRGALADLVRDHPLFGEAGAS